MSFADEQILIFDGACGTNLQEMAIPEAAWQGCAGCNELLNLTAPETIVALHQSFLDAGAMVVETNTFGASSIVLAEYDLADQDRRDQPCGGRQCPGRDRRSPRLLRGRLGRADHQAAVAGAHLRRCPGAVARTSSSGPWSRPGSTP